MLNKVFAGFVVVFWATMMAALIRVEIYPKPTILDTCPTEQVLKKVFANPTPARLDVYRGQPIGEPIGHCRIEIRPKFNGGDVQPGQEPDAYEVTSDLKMRLPLWGVSFWFLKGVSTFNRQFDLEVFDVTVQTTRRGKNSFSIKGDDATKKVTVRFDLGDFQDQRTFDYGDIRGAGLASGLGIPGLPNLDLTVDNLAPRASNNGPRPHLTTTSYFDRLDIAGSRQRVYLIHSKFGDQYWTKIWVSEADGEVLKVSTSLGFEMVSELLKAGASQ
jgi:hypothetical protein